MVFWSLKWDFPYFPQNKPFCWTLNDTMVINIYAITVLMNFDPSQHISNPQMTQFVFSWIIHALCKLDKPTMVDHGQSITAMVKHGQLRLKIFSLLWPWSDMLRTMADHGQPWSTMVDNGDHGDHAWPWSVHHGWPLLTIVNHGWPWLTMADHGQPWLTMVTMVTMVDHGQYTMVDHCWPW